VDSAIHARAAPGAVVAISVRGVRYIHGTGQLAIGDTTRPDASTLYDLASLTKVIGLTTGLMFQVASGSIRLDEPVQTYVPAFVGPDKDRITIRSLLTHSSGLPDHRRLWELTGNRADALALVNATPLTASPGARTTYSDLGAMVLMEALEHAAGMRIDTLLSRRLFSPLGMTSTGYLPPATWLPRIAPTEDDPWRGHVLRGDVHDENARRLDGVSGHAGLFSDAEDLLRFGEWLLDQRDPAPSDGPRPGPSLPQDVVREFTRRQEVVAGSSRALGWDTPTPGGSAGIRLSPASFGHTGFTGTSIWIDPTRRLVVVLLSNRVHPTRDNPRLGPLRGATANRTVDVLDDSAPPPRG
jgi:CubicO group peptidase (beta-lactamase class C family)